METEALAFPRSDDGRVVAGVVAGFARRHRVHPLVVRGVLMVLTFAGGLGLALYALGAAVSTPSPTQPVDAEPFEPRRNAAVACIGLGLMLLVRSTGLWLGDALMFPLAALVAGGVVLGLVPGDGTGSGVSGTRLSDVMGGRHAKVRIGVGSALLVLGFVVVATGDDVSGAVRAGALAAAAAVVGLALLLGPWIAGLVQSAAEERRERIRAEEREAMAAHLHDSVLQTLALIQRSADDPRRTTTLARQQEQELRDWLYGAGESTSRSFAAALRAMATEEEARHQVRIDVVVVGDADVDDELLALVAAAREACVNAAKHSGRADASVYAEVGGDAVEVFVRDRGVGFDPKDAAADRMGIAHSMVARLERVGGTVHIDSTPGVGTEVQLRVPRTHRAEQGDRVAP
jgi:phage shock protein PspC (stress-responsive transcriptional regulator)/anti-sigma regulatory factor (Ser/Thr protein kinase)